MAGYPANASAEAPLVFQSPSAHISCQLYWFESNTASVGCEIRDQAFATPPRPSNCQGAWGDSVGLMQGEPARLDCHSSTLFGGGTAMLPYGGSRTLGAITCDNEPPA